MKLLVCHVPAGSGHEKAAEAVHRAILQLQPTAEVILMNGLDGMSAGYQWAFTQGYIGLIHRHPWLWGLAYHLTDLRGLAWAAYKVHRLTNASHGKVLEEIVLRHNPDLFIATHFFPMEVASYLKLRGKLQGRLITVITDFRPHNVWISPGIDAYCVASELTREELIRRGVPPERIHVLGIPIDPKFIPELDRREAAQRLGIRPDLFTVLVCSGGFGTGPVQQLVENLARLKPGAQLLVVTGKNSALLRQLEKLQPTFPHPLRLYGFVENMQELMEVSDLLVTKPGGLSCAEAMAKGLPMVLAFPIPGQESRNARAVEVIGAGVRMGRVQDLAALVESLRADPERLRRMSEKGSRAARPRAAFEIAQLALSGTGHGSTSSP